MFIYLLIMFIYNAYLLYTVILQKYKLINNPYLEWHLINKNTLNTYIKSVIKQTCDTVLEGN